MSISQKLLDKLVCPNCKTKLVYDDKSERLLCNSCQLAYRINNDVPVLLPDEAEKI